MLRPFRIRDLHQEPTRQNLYDAETESSPSLVQPNLSDLSTPNTSRHGTVHLSAPEYDDIVTSHPRAVLTYMDEDDGEVITVGSSVELIQRLDELIEQSTYCLPPSDAYHYDDTTPMHLFDIRRSNSVAELWKTVEKNSTLRSITPGQNLRSISDISAIESVEETDSESAQNASQSDIRSRWFQACNAPSFKSNIQDGDVEGVEQNRASSGETTPRLSFGNQINVLSEIDKDSALPSMRSSHLTPEGRRQAQEAGLRLGAARRLVLGNEITPTIAIDHQINPWAASFKIEEREVKNETPPTAHQASETLVEVSTRETERDSESLLSAFEAEMAKVMEASTESATSTHVQRGPDGESTSTGNTEEQPGPSQAGPSPVPAEVLVNILRNVANGVEVLGSQLISQVPEVERHLANAQRNFPRHAGQAFHRALASVDTHAKSLGSILQEASAKTGHAAERVRQAELRSAEQVIESLSKVASEFGELGRALFAAFENEFRRENHANLDNPSPASQQPKEPLAQDQPIVTSSVPAPEPSSTKSNIDSSSSITHNREGTQDSKPNVDTTIPLADQTSSMDLPIQAGDTASNPKSPVVEDKGKSFVRDISPIPSADKGPIPPPKKPILFSNWPNRPAVLLPPSKTSAGSMLPAIPPRQHEPKTQRDGPSDQTSGSSPALATMTSQHPKTSHETHANCLFVGNLSPNATEQNVVDMFVDKGFLAQVRLAIDAETKRHAGFGYAHFKSTHAAKGALDACQNSTILGIPTNLEFSDSFSFEQLQESLPLEGRTQTSNTQTDSAPTSRRPNRRSRYRRSWHLASDIVSDVPVRQGAAENSPLAPPPRSEFSFPPQRLTINSSDEQPVDRPADAQLPSEQSQHASKTLFVSNPFSDDAAILDQETKNTTLSVRYPPLLNHEATNPTTDMDPRVSINPDSHPHSPESVMSRFPPLSQLDAQFVPTRDVRVSAADFQRSDPAHQSDVPPKIPPKPKPSTVWQDNAQRAPEWPWREGPGVKSSAPGEDIPLTPRYSLTEPQILGTTPRRSVTMSQRRRGPIRPVPSLSRLTQPFSPPIVKESQIPERNLRRSATERLPPRRHVTAYPAPQPTGHVERDSGRQIPGSFPQEPYDVEATDANLDHDIRIAVRQSEIDQCVGNLLSLGYGSSFDGGRGRITVVAEAVGGRLSDAIEMIEEERKAYAEERRAYASS